MSLAESSEMLKRPPAGWTNERLHAANKKLRRVVILQTLWYPEIIHGLLESAQNYLAAQGVPSKVIELVSVPGSFELPLAMQQCLPADIVIALGCIIRGGTPHFDYVCQATAQGLMRVQLDAKVPLGFGVLTVNDVSEARARADKGAEAAQAAYFMYLNGLTSGVRAGEIA